MVYNFKSLQPSAFVLQLQNNFPEDIPTSRPFPSYVNFVVRLIKYAKLRVKHKYFLKRQSHVFSKKEGGDYCGSRPF